MNCQSLRDLEVDGKPLSTHLLEPLLKSDVGSSLNFFKYRCFSTGALEELEVILPLLQNIEEFSLDFIYGFDTPGVTVPFRRVFRSQWPQSIHVLRLSLRSAKRITYLEELASLLSGRLASLRELHLIGVPGCYPEEAKLGYFLGRMPKLETLVIESPKAQSAFEQRLAITGLLGLLPIHRLNEGFLHLRTLILGGSIDWFALGCQLDEGSFPLLSEVYHLETEDRGPRWYERDTHTTDLWLKLMVSRNMKVFNNPNRDQPFPGPSWNTPGPELITHYLLGISQLTVKATSCLMSLGFYNVALNDDNCSALTKAIGSGVLNSTVDLAFYPDLPLCTPGTLTGLGSVMTSHLLPSLKILTIGARGGDNVPCSTSKWRAFFAGVPLCGLDALQYLTLDAFQLNGSSIWPILEAMAFPGKSIILPCLVGLEIGMDVPRHKDLSALSAALMNGMCPNLEHLEFSGKG